MVCLFANRYRASSYNVFGTSVEHGIRARECADDGAGMLTRARLQLLARFCCRKSARLRAET